MGNICIFNVTQWLLVWLTLVRMQKHTCKSLFAVPHNICLLQIDACKLPLKKIAKQLVLLKSHGPHLLSGTLLSHSAWTFMFLTLNWRRTLCFWEANKQRLRFWRISEVAGRIFFLPLCCIWVRNRAKGGRLHRFMCSHSCRVNRLIGFRGFRRFDWSHARQRLAEPAFLWKAADISPGKS